MPLSAGRRADLFSMVGKPLPTSYEDGIPEVLKTERMGHEMPGMHGVYGHVSPAMRADLKAALQARWEGSLRARARLGPRSIVPTLDALLAVSCPSNVSHRGPDLQGCFKLARRLTGLDVPLM